MHPIADHELFVRVADRKGFTAAGRELRLSTAVVSSRIAKLEQKLGHKLFVRNTRDVSMTEEGALYYAFCQRIISEEAELEKQLQEIKAQPSGSLKLSAPIAIGRKLIAPLAPEFQRDNADVQIRLQLTDRLANIIDEDIDIAVRTGELDASSLITVTLGPDIRIVCGAPGYFENNPPLKSLEDLKDHNCLLLRFPGSRRYYWRFELADGQPKNIMAAGAFDSDSSDILLEWALGGHGLIMTSIWDVYDELMSGALRPTLLPFCKSDESVHAVMPPRSPQPIKTTAFIDVARAAFKAHGAYELADKETLIKKFGG